MHRLLRSRVFLAALFGVIGAAAVLAATGNLPGLDDDEDPRSARVVERDSNAGTSFTTRTPAPRRSEPATGAVRRTTSYPYEDDDYRSQLYEQYFGEPEDEEDDDYVYVPPEENGGGPGQPGEPGEPGIPDDGEGGGEGGPAGPGGAGGDG
ncbi:MAG: hypothetical protein ACRDKJ_08305 [Actinomycetota bacterium]